MTASILVLLVTYMRPSELLALRKKDLVPPLVPLLPYWSIVLADSETGVSTETGNRWIGPRGPAVASMGQQAPARTPGRTSAGENLEFRFPAAATFFKTVSDTLGLTSLALYQTRHRGASIDMHEVQRRGQWKAFSSVTRYDRSSFLAADCQSLPRLLRDKPETLAQRADILFDKATATLVARKRMTRKKNMLDVFRGSGFLTKATNHLGFGWPCAQHEMWSQR